MAISMKKTIVIVVIIGSLVGVTIWLIHYLTYGKIVITTNNNNLITISKANDEKYKAGNSSFSKQARKTLSVSVRSGEYLISVRSNVSAVSQRIEVKAHQTTKLVLNPTQPKGVEPVEYRSAASFTADSSQLLYVDLLDKKIYQINNQNAVRVFDSELSFQTIKWSNPSYGVGKSLDGQLYIISGGSISRLDVPFAYNSDRFVNYDIAPNKQLYVASGSDIYTGTEEKGFKKIYTAATSSPSFAASQDKLAVLETGQKNGKGGNATVTVVYQTGKTVRKNMEAYTASWSPNGKNLIISSDSESVVTDDNLNEVAFIPQSNIISPIWLDDSNLIYGVADQLWSFNIGSGLANLIANMPLGSPISQLALSSDKSYVYFSTGYGNSNLVIKRVGLKDQTIPPDLFKLQSILPETLDQCSLSLINFTTPTVVISVSSGSAQQICDQAARDELQQAGFDLSKLQFKFAS